MSGIILFYDEASSPLLFGTFIHPSVLASARQLRWSRVVQVSKVTAIICFKDNYRISLLVVHFVIGEKFLSSSILLSLFVDYCD